MRPLVLRTALTYLELLGVLRQKTPTYAGYKVRLLRPRDEVLAQFKGEPRQFLAAVFDNAKAGRIWLRDRSRRGRARPSVTIERASCGRSRCSRSAGSPSSPPPTSATATSGSQRTRTATTLVAELASRFARREAQEIERLAQVLALAERADCHTNALVAHFGEVRAAPCGHCVPCRTGKVVAPAPPRFGSAASGRPRRRARCGRSREASRRARSAASACALARRSHEPRAHAREAHASPALRRARRASVPRGADLVRERRRATCARRRESCSTLAP